MIQRWVKITSTQVRSSQTRDKQDHLALLLWTTPYNSETVPQEHGLMNKVIYLVNAHPLFQSAVWAKVGTNKVLYGTTKATQLRYYQSHAATVQPKPRSYGTTKAMQLWYYQSHAATVLPKPRSYGTTKATQLWYYQSHTATVLPKPHRHGTTKATQTRYYQSHTAMVLPKPHSYGTTKATQTRYYQSHTDTVLPKPHRHGTTKATQLKTQQICLNWLEICLTDKLSISLPFPLSAQADRQTSTKH